MINKNHPNEKNVKTNFNEAQVRSKVVNHNRQLLNKVNKMLFDQCDNISTTKCCVIKYSRSGYLTNESDQAILTYV